MAKNMSEMLFLQVRFSEEGPLYTYVAKSDWFPNLKAGDYLAVPVRDGSIKIVQFVRAMLNPPKANIDLKYAIQHIDPSFVQRSIDAGVYKLSATYSR
jgi:hypothetical protein